MTVLDVPCSLDGGDSRIMTSMALGSCDRAYSERETSSSRERMAGNQSVRLFLSSSTTYCSVPVSSVLGFSEIAIMNAM